MENPSGGNEMIFPDVNDAPTTMIVGKERIRIENKTKDPKIILCDLLIMACHPC
jgi:hypothetical protein